MPRAPERRILLNMSIEESPDRQSVPNQSDPVEEVESKSILPPPAPEIACGPFDDMRRGSLYAFKRWTTEGRKLGEKEEKSE